MPTKVIDEVIKDVVFELGVNRAAHAPLGTPEDGWEALMGEIRELRHTVFYDVEKRRPEDVRTKACQVAAIAIRIMTDCC